MRTWEDLDIRTKVETILNRVPWPEPDHHFGRPFVTAYQIAIEFAQSYPHEIERLGLETGGRGTGLHYSLAQRLALELSTRIKNGEIQNIEGRFLSNFDVTELKFNNYGSPLYSSATGNNATISMFRLI